MLPLLFLDADQIGTRVEILFFTPLHPIVRLAMVYDLYGLKVSGGWKSRQVGRVEYCVMRMMSKECLYRLGHGCQISKGPWKQSGIPYRHGNEMSSR